MSHRIFLALLGIIFFATACAGPQINWTDNSQIANAITVTRDDFEKTTMYVGPHFKGAKTEEVWLRARILLRAYKYDKTGAISYQVYMYESYTDDWRFYNQAYDSDGNEMNLVTINQKVKSCGPAACIKEEDTALNVTETYLEAHKDAGISVKLSGKSHEQVWFLPGNYIKVFLSVVRAKPIIQEGHANE